jgi:hypothetical protein
VLLAVLNACFALPRLSLNPASPGSTAGTSTSPNASSQSTDDNYVVTATAADSAQLTPPKPRLSASFHHSILSANTLNSSADAQKRARGRLCSAVLEACGSGLRWVLHNELFNAVAIAVYSAAAYLRSTKFNAPPSSDNDWSLSPAFCSRLLTCGGWLLYLHSYRSIPLFASAFSPASPSDSVIDSVAPARRLEAALILAGAILTALFAFTEVC